MQLYFKAGACSLASRITMLELGIPFQAIPVDTATGETGEGTDFRIINPKGYVPALRLDDGQVLTENPAILQYLADLRPDPGMAPPAGTMPRVRMQEWLAFIASELHKCFAPWFSGRTLTDEEKARASAALARRLGDVERGLQDGRDWLLGAQFSVVDAYLFVVLNWTGFIGFDLARWPHLQRFMRSAGTRPGVRAALQAEGLQIAEAA